ncbi:Mitotic-spindle organizing protein 1 [Chamberlinius hualienensis]
MADSTKRVKYVDAKEAFQILIEMSKILNTGLDDETLSLCLKLSQNGINPKALADVVKELRNVTQMANNNAKATTESKTSI